MVSDENHKECIECFNKEYFYLEKYSFNEPTCIYRNFNDPTETCLEYWEDAPGCRICAPGLTPTLNGCIVDTSYESQYN